jgi:peptide/nickel transport system permease protein
LRSNARYEGISHILRKLAGLVAIALVGGILTATLVRFSPGYGVDERELDSRLSPSSVEAIRAQRQANSNLLRYYGHYVVGLSRGDFGKSEWLQVPVRDLLHERFPVTLKSVSLAILAAWTLAFVLALIGVFLGGWIFDTSATVFTSSLVALPYAVVALLFVYMRAPVFLAIATILFPKLFRYMRNLLAHAAAQPYVLAAHARGIAIPWITWRYAVRLAAPALVSLFGVSFSMAFGAAIPVEALCDSPGIGQLAWQAAINRDLPLIVNLTFILTLITVSANWLASACLPATTARQR